MILCVLPLIPVLLLAAGVADAAEKKTVLGAVEEVILLPWGLKLPARVDSGAAKSSLDARGLKVNDNIAEFHLPEGHGGLTLRLPVLEWRHIRTNTGLRLRPVVQLELCLGPHRLRTKVALDDRTGLTYPFLVGRNTLSGKFVVDVKQKRIAPPNCRPSSDPKDAFEGEPGARQSRTEQGDKILLSLSTPNLICYNKFVADSARLLIEAKRGAVTEGRGL